MVFHHHGHRRLLYSAQPYPLQWRLTVLAFCHCLRSEHYLVHRRRIRVGNSLSGLAKDLENHAT
jgi:hypothetical protein